MTKSQAKNKSNQLVIALQVMFDNAAKAGMDSVVVKNVLAGPTQFEFSINPDGYIELDTVQIAREIEKILPNARVTSCSICFTGRAFTFVVKELGRIGYYQFNFVCR